MRCFRLSFGQHIAVVGRLRSFTLTTCPLTCPLTHSLAHLLALRRCFQPRHYQTRHFRVPCREGRTDPARGLWCWQMRIRRVCCPDCFPCSISLLACSIFQDVTPQPLLIRIQSVLKQFADLPEEEVCNIPNRCLFACWPSYLITFAMCPSKFVRSF